jgi:hypothetical protein
LQHEVRFVDPSQHTKDRSTPEGAPACWQEREDYFECLHSKKEYAHVQAVLDEKHAQEYEKKHGIRPAHSTAH